MTIEAETVLGYRQRADHIQRDLGTIPLKQLTPMDIQAFYAHLTEDRHLSARTVNFTHTVLKMALQDAVEWGVILRNPAAKAKAKARPGLRTQTLRIPTPEEMAQLIRANRQTRWYPLWVWFVVTGSRLGEALALQWQDIDWEKGQVTIRRALSGDAARRILKHPKSASGIRTLQMGPKLTRILQEHARNQQDWQRLAGSQWVESGHVFTTQQGNSWGSATSSGPSNRPWRGRRCRMRSAFMISGTAAPPRGYLPGSIRNW